MAAYVDNETIHVAFLFRMNIRTNTLGFGLLPLHFTQTLNAFYPSSISPVRLLLLCGLIPFVSSFTFIVSFSLNLSHSLFARSNCELLIGFGLKAPNSSFWTSRASLQLHQELRLPQVLRRPRAPVL